MLHCVFSWKSTNVSEVLTASTIRAMMMEAVHTSETSVNLYQTTRRKISEGCHLHTRHLENLKSHYRNIVPQSSTGGGDSSQNGGGGSDVLSLLSGVLGSSSDVSNKVPSEGLS
jgi:hypothetical protein